MFTFLEKDAFADDDTFDTKERKFMMAFSLTDYWTEEFKNDPRYIKWFARYIRVKDNINEETREIPMHVCTDEDYEKFYPVDVRSAGRLSLLRNEAERGMLCIDWETAEIDFFGVESSGTYSELDVVVMPCNVMGTPLGGLEDKIPEECVADL